MSEKMLIKKLAKVMQQVKYIEKKGFNKFHQYKYATESDIAEKVREVLAEENVMMIPNMKEHSVRTHITAKEKTEYIATVLIEFTFMDGDTGETLVFCMAGEGQDAGDKAYYKAITGAQKYALMKAFMIPTGDDPEGDAGVDERNETTQSTTQSNKLSEGQTKKITEPQRKRMFALSPGNADVVKTVIMRHGYTKTEDVEKEKYEKICNEIKEEFNQKGA